MSTELHFPSSYVCSIETLSSNKDEIQKELLENAGYRVFSDKNFEMGLFRDTSDTFLLNCLAVSVFRRSAGFVHFTANNTHYIAKPSTEPSKVGTLVVEKINSYLNETTLFDHDSQIYIVKSFNTDKKEIKYSMLSGIARELLSNINFVFGMFRHCTETSITRCYCVRLTQRIGNKVEFIANNRLYECELRNPDDTYSNSLYIQIIKLKKRFHPLNK